MSASATPRPRRLRWSRALVRAAWAGLAAWLPPTAPAAENTSASVPTAGVPLPPLERGLPVLRTFLPRDYRGLEQIWTIAETDRGLLLFGNLHHVLEYDGLHWRAIPVPGGSYVRAMANDATGTVWVAGVNELGRLVPGADGQLAYVSFRDRVPADLGDLGGIWCVHAQPDGVYFQRNLALLRWDGAKFDVWRTDQKTTVLSFFWGHPARRAGKRLVHPAPRRPLATNRRRRTRPLAAALRPARPRRPHARRPRHQGHLRLRTRHHRAAPDRDRRVAHHEKTLLRPPARGRPLSVHLVARRRRAPRSRPEIRTALR